MSKVAAILPTVQRGNLNDLQCRSRATGHQSNKLTELMKRLHAAPSTQSLAGIQSASSIQHIAVDCPGENTCSFISQKQNRALGPFSPPSLRFVILYTHKHIFLRHTRALYICRYKKKHAHNELRIQPPS